jgi:integrase
MASISTAKGGLRTVQFVDPIDGKRRSIRLGKTSMRLAGEIKIKVEHLVAAKASNTPVEPALSQWLDGILDDLHSKLASVGLVAERNGALLGSFLKTYVASRTDVKPRTTINLNATRTRLVDFFGEGRSLRTITEADADAFLVWMKAEEYAPATTGRTIKRCRQFFKAAVRQKLLLANPFADVKAPSMVNATRTFFITEAMARNVLDACPDAEWRLLFALSRYGGLRCPSEHLHLTWADVDWVAGKIRIHSPKKEADDHGGERLIPIFPELRPYLEECLERAEPGTIHLINRYRDSNTNLRTQLGRIVRQAGLKTWPRLFQNLRASRETELLAKHPMHVVCDWIGNSALVAKAHYCQVIEADFERASFAGPRSGAISGAVAVETVQNQVQQEAAVIRTNGPKNEKGPEKPASFQELANSCDSLLDLPVPLLGLEPSDATALNNSRLRRAKNPSGAESGAVSDDFDPERLPALWPTFSENVRRSIAALVAFALGNRPHNPQNG